MTNSRSHANLVMFAVEYMTQQADPDVNIDNPEYHAAVLKELYELHKLRDFRITECLTYHYTVGGGDHPISDLLWELYHA